MIARVSLRLTALAAILLAGCGTAEKPADLFAKIKDAQAAAQKACEAQDSKAARAAAQDAAEALAALKAQSENTAKTEASETADAPDALAQAELGAAEAERWAQLAEEEQQWREVVQGLRGKAYRTARGTAYAATLEGLALACDQTAKYPPDQVPESLKPLAKAANDVASFVPDQSGATPSPEATAKTLRTLKDQPPELLSPYVAVSLALSGHTRMALMEYEGFASKEFKDKPEARVFEAVLFRRHGLDRMADRALATTGGGTEARMNECALYLALACMEAQEKHWTEADRYLSMTFRAAPNNALAVFLTGERLAADGKREEAAHSLESIATGLDSDAEKMVVTALRDRARAIRDAKGPPEGFLGDPALIYAVLRLALREQGKQDATVKAVSDKLEAAHALADRLRAALP